MSGAKTLHRSKIWDINAEFFGVSVELLMENAGKGVAESVYPLAKKFLCVIGPGNNGGDGLVCARYLHSMGCDVQVYFIKPVEVMENELVKMQLERLLRVLPSTNIIQVLPRKTESIVIDACFGTGFTGSWRTEYSEVKEFLQKARNVISIDVPSGFPHDPISAKQVIALEHAEEELKQHCRKKNVSLVVQPIGIPTEAKECVGPAQVQMYFPVRKKTSHKGENGELVIIGGSAQYIGAPINAALGAIRSGVDLIHVWMPKMALRTVERFYPELIFHYYDKDAISEKDRTAIQATIESADAILFGPGLTYDKDIHKSVIQLLAYSYKQNKKILLDADAIYSHETYPDKMKNWGIIPHAGEWKRFCMGLSDTNPSLVARKKNLTIIKKGAVDEIFAPNGELIKNCTGNEVLTKGGTGDVLAGLIAGFAARDCSLYQAGQLGAFFLGCAGDTLKNHMGASFTLNELSVTLGSVISNYGQ